MQNFLKYINVMTNLTLAASRVRFISFSSVRSSGNCTFSTSTSTLQHW